MDPITLQFAAEACHGRLVAGLGTATATRVCTDSRQVRPGDLFVALTGERFDGHKFLGPAAAAGAVGLVVEVAREPASPGGCGVISVAHTRRALGELSGAYRRRFSNPVIAVAGSNGKTTTKELAASVLRQRMAVAASEASFNNDIGVPLTLLQIEGKHGAAVVEVGTNHPGELAPLVQMIQPRFGVITSIGREHQEFFKNLEGVAEEEGWLAALLPADGKLFIHGDHPLTDRIVKRACATVVRVGEGPRNDWRVSRVRVEKDGVGFSLESPRAEYNGEYRVRLLGRHQALNATYAICLGAELGLDRAAIAAGLMACEPPKMRMQSWELNGVRVLDDAYNANADSVLAALQTLVEMPCKGRRVAVLGDMAELGAQSDEAHAEVGRRAAELGVEQLFAVGRMAGVVARAARQSGLNRVLEFADVEATASAVRSFVRPGDLLLLKASRSSRLERVAELLQVVEKVRKN